MSSIAVVFDGGKNIVINSNAYISSVDLVKMCHTLVKAGFYDFVI